MNIAMHDSPRSTCIQEQLIMLPGTRLRAATAVALLAAAMQLKLATCVHNDLEEEYHFSAVLDNGYKLHWNFDLQQQNISFAVNVSTTGWVGFGLSPNGQMPGSDVVIGWVDNSGNTQFHDCFAIDRFLPPIDESQDWFLISGEEENGYTIMEFTRNLTTCDKNDLDIKADTSRVIWAYHSLDPVSLESLDGSLQHERMGSISINLIGGNNEDRTEQNDNYFILKNENLTIPNKDTTYWCSVLTLPAEVREQERYVYKWGPVISESSAPYVHHLLVYVCSELNHTHAGASSECVDTHIDIGLCKGGGDFLATWAVGGDDFIYPNDVAFPIGGEGNAKYVILETHFDNQAEVSGVEDSSGLKFTYTNEPPRHRAGIITVGFAHTNHFIVPPGRDNYIINGLCPGKCTKNFLPPEGIKVFGNGLHTHLAGHGLVVRHFRQNDECGLLEELPLIDENRKYDFNYQQYMHLPREVTILPGDTIQVQCFYQTTGLRNVTLGGRSTRQEMCYSFMLYYPEVTLTTCTSEAPFRSYTDFIEQHIQPSQHENFYSSLLSYDSATAQTILDQVEWTDDATTMMEKLLATTYSSTCVDSNNLTNTLFVDVPNPSADCPYEAPNKCTDTQPQDCCERLQVPSSATSQAQFHQLLYTIMAAYYAFNLAI